MATGGFMPEETAKKHTYLFRNWLTLAGLVIALGGLFAFLLLFAIDLFAHHGNPYMGILAYVVAPGFMILGLLLCGLGAWIQRRHLRKSALASTSHPLMIDFSRPRDRRALGGFLAGAVLFLLLTAIGSNRTYHYTESVQFCGQTCHTPMKAEFTTYNHSPHARVACIACHVGPGATWYVKSKINGVHQLYSTLKGDFDRPIKTPIRNLRPAQETCEQCHWPQRFAGNVDRTYWHFLADETNTPFAVRLLLKVGGGDPSRGPAGGIHWHMNLANKVEYIATDERRQVIPWVRFTDTNGVVTEYQTADFKHDPNKSSIRTMDCIDCHNRPAHRFQSPNDAVDFAMAGGRIDATIPWIKSNAVAALVQRYSTEGEAMQKINASLRANYPNAQQLDSLIRNVQHIYRNNFFPEMRADWRAYPDNLNHKDGAGCFRCHDGLHKTSDGKRSIKASDCNACHTILAQGSGEQLEKLNPKGHAFFHIDAVNEDFSCNSCHTGAFPKE
jgi:nitrate/TMAO reductase-like tetraheme cytochrome c subunit